MHRIGIWLGVLLFIGVALVVLERDSSVPVTAKNTPSLPALTNAPKMNWTNAAARFRGEARVVAERESFDVATQRKTVVEIVKTTSKYPYVRVETEFQFDPVTQAWMPQPPIEYVADQVMLELKAGTTEKQLAQALEKVGGRIVQTHEAGDARMVLVGLAQPTPEAVPNALKHLNQSFNLFEVVEPHVIRRASATPNDPRLTEQWPLQSIKAAAGWDLQRGKAGVVVAVLDSGIDFYHAELGARVWNNPGERAGNRVDDDRNGYVDDYRGMNFAYENANPYDDLDHGTFVSGIIAAAADNAHGIAGLCWDVRIMAVKVIDYNGLVYGLDEIRGYDYARTEGAKIINASFGGRVYSQSEMNAINRLRAAGVLFVAAAGNDGVNADASPRYPACYAANNIISVGYSDINDDLSPNSNWGPLNVDLAAPGVAVLSTIPGGWFEIGSGSSYAAPHVTGVAALMRAQFPAYTYAQIKAAILSNTDPRSSLTGRCVTGGRLNAFEPLIPRVPLTNALDSGALVWQTGGARPWFGFRLISVDGVDSARCGNIGDYHSSWLQSTVTGPGHVSFHWKVSSEANFDYLQFWIDGQLQAAIHGEVDWAPATFTVPAGTHTLRWTYIKDGSVSSGTDKGYLDMVSFVRDTTGPAVVITAPADTNLYGTTTLDLQGTAADPSGVVAVEYSVGSEPWQTVETGDGFATWQAQLSNLALGTNLVRVRGVDGLSLTSVVRRTYVVLSPITININGCGSLSPDFAGTTWQQSGRTLSVRAIPCGRHLFTSWSGDLSSSNGLLTFIMQPNMNLQANFMTNPFATLPGYFNGLFYEGSGVLHESSGLFKMTLTDTGAFTGSIVVGGATNTFANRFDPATGQCAFSVPRAGKSAVQLALQLDISNGTDTLTGQLSDGIWTADLLADRLVYDPVNNPPPYAGTYTLVFPGGTDFATMPSGYGFATATVNTAGRVAMYGRMPDNWAVMQTIATSKNGDWPFYQPLYLNSGGSVLGWFKFLSAPNGFTNQLTSWLRPSNPNAIYYRSGFSNEFTVVGSPYLTPATNRVIACTNALLTLSGADFATPLTNRMLLTASNTVLNQGPHNVSMRVTRTNGTFTGTVIFSPTRSNNFQGVFLQAQNIGLGYFVGSNYMGAVRFEPE